MHHHHCVLVRGCRFCKFLSRTCGHFLMFILGKKWPRLEREQILPFVEGVDLELVGGLKERGWTIHDIDVVGDLRDVPKFVSQVRNAGIKNPVHFCDFGSKNHSHWLTIKDGLKALFIGDQMYC